MQTKYFSPIEFGKLEVVETYPNEDVVVAIIDGIRTKCHKSATITISKLTDDECQWHNLPNGYYGINSSNGFCPNDLLAGVIKGCYDSDGKTALSKLTGFNTGKNFGTASCGISNYKAVKKILENNGWKVIMKLDESQLANISYMLLESKKEIPEKVVKFIYDKFDIQLDNPGKFTKGGFTVDWYGERNNFNPHFSKLEKCGNSYGGLFTIQSGGANSIFIIPTQKLLKEI